MRKLLLLVLLCGMTVQLSAQADTLAGEKVKITLKNNGQTARGVVWLESETAVSLKRSGGDILTIPRSRIASIERVEDIVAERAKHASEREERTSERQTVRQLKPYKFLEPGHSFVFEVGAGPAVGDYGLNKFSGNLIYEYRTGSVLNLGAGTGLSYFWDESGNETVAPVYARLRINFVRERVTPFLSVNLGYNFSLENKKRKMLEGFLIEPGFGVAVAVGEKNALLFSMVYSMNQFELPRTYGYWGLISDSSKKFSGAFLFRVGVQF